VYIVAGRILECAVDAAAVAIITADNALWLTASVYPHCRAICPTADTFARRRQRAGCYSYQK